MNAIIHDPRSPAWARLRIAAAEYRDKGQPSASALCKLLDVYDALRQHSTLSPVLWNSCQMLAKQFQEDVCLDLENGDKH